MKLYDLFRVPLRQYGRFESRDSAEQSEHHQNRRSLSGFGIFMQIGKFLQDIVEPETSMKKPNGGLKPYFGLLNFHLRKFHLQK